LPPVTTRIFPSAENPLGLALALSEQLRCSEPCPRSLSDGFRSAYPSPKLIKGKTLRNTITAGNSLNFFIQRRAKNRANALLALFSGDATAELALRRTQYGGNPLARNYVSERRSGRRSDLPTTSEDKIGVRLRDRGGFSLSEPFFEGSRSGRDRPAKHV